MQENTQPKYLTIAEAATILRVSPLSLQNNISRAPQNCPPFTRIGRLVRFNDILLHKHMLDGTVNPPSPLKLDHAHLNSVNKKRGRPRKASLESGVAK